MKNLLFIIFTVLSAICLLQIPASAQNRYINLDDKVNQNGDLINYVRIDFLLEPLLPLSEIGFDNPQSNWKVEYEVFLTETSELEKIGRCQRDEFHRFICPLIIEKKDRQKYRRQIKSKLVKIYQGSFDRNNLAEESNRDFEMLIPLSPEIVKILNNAKTSESNPAFVLFSKIKFNLKNSQNQKFKETREGDGVLPLKAYHEGKKYSTFDLNRKEITVGWAITKSPGGRIISVPYGR